MGVMLVLGDLPPVYHHGCPFPQTPASVLAHSLTQSVVWGWGGARGR